MTVLAAGPGFGKSSLLVQAIDENALAPRGDDHWLGCDAGDGDHRTLADGLANALRTDVPRVDEPGDVGPSELGAALADTVWRNAPRQVCLVLDDVHEVPADSPAAGLLATLVEALPTNGHLVLAGRQEPPVPLSRVAAQGWLARIDESELAFADDELESFARLREVPLHRVDDLGGWPALAELRTLGPGHDVDGFLAEEVLAHLSNDERRAVAVVAAVGGADQALLDAVLDRSVDLATLASRIPLVTSDDRGWHAIHPLWSERLSAGILDPEARAEAQRRAGRALVGQDLQQGAGLLIRAGADDDLRAALRTSCRAHALPASAQGLGRLHRELPAAVRSTPEGELLAGIATAATDIDRGVELLESAAQRFAGPDEGGEDDELGLLSAVEHLAICAHWREDVALLERLLPYADQLTKIPEAQGLLGLGQALLADTAGDARGVLAALDAIDPGALGPYWSPQVAWLRATALLALGFPEAARRGVEVAVAEAGPSLRGGLSMLQVNALTHCGEHDAAAAALDRMLTQLAPAGNDHLLALAHTMVVTRCALDGDVERAEQHMARARQHAGPSPRPSLQASMLAADATLALATGDEAGAAALFASQLAEHKLTEGRQAYGHLRRIALLYVLVPETRDPFAHLELGPAYETGLALATALVASREAGDLAPAAGLTPEHWAAARAFLPVSWRAELACSAVAGGQSDAEALVKDLGPTARPALRKVADRATAPRALRTWARSLLDALPTVPAAALELGLLGPTTLRRDGRPVDHPHWRRERVRALLLLLMTRGGGTREELAGALWPDLDSAAALRNLRVTLSYLLAVLEPDRAEGAPSCFVRAEGAGLRLTGHEWLRVDAWEMERLLDLGAQAESLGEPSAALDSYRAATRLYRGPYLIDAGYEEWALPHRDRLVARFVAGAVRAGELTLAAGRSDEALHLASRALEAEPWSEPAHRLAVAAHVARGDRAAARRAMDTCVRQLNELGVPPTEDTEIVFRAVTG
ncbi:MAG TPA: BTAD domain-containing putative transcriptional regulator [Acidimicrobiales bacterium]|nr:BTAD domain-containing putative transcriptional regulator [Acidimicrobiales bacterium]